MSEAAAVEQALAAAAADLAAAGKAFALVGGLAVSVRAEVRFTRDILSRRSMWDARGERDSPAPALPPLA